MIRAVNIYLWKDEKFMNFKYKCDYKIPKTARDVLIILLQKPGVKTCQLCRKIFDENLNYEIIVYYVPRRTMRVIA